MQKDLKKKIKINQDRKARYFKNKQMEILE